MAEVIKEKALQQLPYFDYLDWSAITQAERTILYDMLFKEPEASEAQRRLFEFLILNTGEVIPPIPVFRLPDKCQEEGMSHLTNILNLHQIHHPPPHSAVASYGIIPVVTSGQNGHPLTNQQGTVWVDTQGGGQGPPPGLRNSFPGQMVQVPSNYYQMAAHHQQQQYGSPNSYMTHMGVPPHYAHHAMPPLQHIYASQLQQPYTEELTHGPPHQPNKSVDLHSSTSVSSTGSSSNTKGYNRKGPPRTQGRSEHQAPQQLNQYAPIPYYQGMGAYGTVYFSPAIAATGQPIIMPPSSQQPTMYQPYPQQHVYPGTELEHHGGNLMQVPSESTPQQHGISRTSAESVKSTPESASDANGPIISLSPPSFKSAPQLEEPQTPPKNRQVPIKSASPVEDLKLGSTGEKSVIPEDEILQTPPQTPPETDKDRRSSSPVEIQKVVESDETLVKPGVVNGPAKGKLASDDQQTNLQSNSVLRKGRTDEKGTTTEFPQLPPNAPVTTNGLKGSQGAASTSDGGQRSWASIASSRVAGGPMINSSLPRIPPSESLSSHGPFLQHTNNEVPIGSTSGVIREPSVAFDPACLSNESDPIALSLGEFLVKYQLNHHCLSLTPRGLVNQSNFCYINATLQSLLACPPFVNLFRSMQQIIGKKPCKATPILQSVFDFVMDFEPISRLSANNKKRPTDAFVSGPPLDPTGIRRVLSLLDGATFKVEGRQEDAEEFLSHLLNGIHDEMVKTIRWYETKKEGKSQGSAPQVQHTPQQPPPSKLNGEGGSGTVGEEEDSEWQVMGPKNKGSMTRKTEVSKSPISEMFVGQMSSLLNRGTGSTPKTTTLQPFFTLQLDIQDESIHSVKDALEGLSTKEEVSGSSTATGVEAPIWKQLSLEFLPIILVIHLKRFVYDKNSCKIFKLDKKVDFGIELSIEKELLSGNSRAKTFHPKQRSYKLFAAVYHDGEEAHKGHYVADTFHPSGGTLWGQFGWIRYDDSDTKGVSENHVLTPQPPRVPYLLYYRRMDTLSTAKKQL